MKKKPIINTKRLDEVSQKIGDLFIKENLTPLEVKVLLDGIQSNVENLSDIFSKANIMKTLTPKNKESEKAMGVS